MVRLIKKTVKKMIATPVLWRSIAVLLRRKGVVTLMYHRVSNGETDFPALPVDKFRSHMQWIKKNCHIIHPRQLSKKVMATRWMRPTVMITFDDGQRCVHDVIYPVLKELDIPATVFLATKFMDEGGMIWTDEITLAFNKTSCQSVMFPWDNNVSLPLSTKEQRQQAIGAAKAFLKEQPDNDRRNWQDKLLRSLGMSDITGQTDRQMLNWDEVRHCSDVFEYGGHTHTHPIMSRLDECALEEEISRCRARMESELGNAPSSFAYPNGRAMDFNEQCKNVLSRYGFRTAFTTIEGINSPEIDSYELRRIPTGVDNTDDLAWMIMRA